MVADRPPPALDWPGVRKPHDPTEANRRRRAVERLRRIGSDRPEPAAITLASRLGLFALGVLLAGGGCWLIHAALAVVTIFVIAVVAGVVGLLVALPGVGFLAAAVLPERYGTAILRAMMAVVGGLVEGLT